MMKLLIFTLTVVQLSHQRSTPEADTYRAAVVEFAAERLDTNDETIRKNSERFADFIKKAGALEVDIIVFPEDGLTSISLPTREEMNDRSTLIPLDYNPCEQNDIPVHEALRTISCAARDAGLYVVINIAERLPCDGEYCPLDGVFFYNAQAVFDRSGKIIAKYRKTHLFQEPQINLTPAPEVVTFDTDFHVTFGLFICFDICFKEPPTTLTRVHNITDIVYSVAWFSELPFLTAVQAHGGWAYSEDVNLLAAGHNRPKLGNFGSGIYLGRQGIGKVVMGISGDELLVYDVPKKNRKLLTDTIKKTLQYEKSTEGNLHEEFRRKRSAPESRVKRGSNNTDDVILWKDGDLKSHETILLNFDLKQQKLCQGDFCCVFSVETSNIDTNSVYRIVVLNGLRTFVDVTIGIQSCGIVLCANNSIASCATRATSKTTFSRVQITATFENPEDLMVLPSSINFNLLPLNWTYTKRTDGNRVHLVGTLNEPASNVLTIGLYGRKFDRDILEIRDILQELSSSGLHIQFVVTIALAVISIVCYLWYRNGCRLTRRREQARPEYTYKPVEK